MAPDAVTVAQAKLRQCCRRMYGSGLKEAVRTYCLRLCQAIKVVDESAAV